MVLVTDITYAVDNYTLPHAQHVCLLMHAEAMHYVPKLLLLHPKGLLLNPRGLLLNQSGQPLTPRRANHRGRRPCLLCKV